MIIVKRSCIKLFFVLILYICVHFLVKYLYNAIYKEDIPQKNYVYFSTTSKQKYRTDDRLFKRQKDFTFPKIDKKVFKRTGMGIFPHHGNNKFDDRIYNQMSYVPFDYLTDDKILEKLILLYVGKFYIHFGDFNMCPVSKCKITTDINTAENADVIVWIRNIKIPHHKRPPNQIWSFLFHESPMNTPNLKNFQDQTKSMFNWTISYRPDSTISLPYYKYTPYDLVNPRPKIYPLPKKNYAAGKNKMVAWFVSNCRSTNDRNEVVKKLQKYIQVDIYGKCGTLSCSRYQSSSCFDLLDKDYKFYLSFENSYCRHYITEKFFLNGLSHNVIPVVLGAHPDDYKRVSPPHSYIHVEDFKTIKDLADYMMYLDKNDTAFNEYFSWKFYGTVSFDQFFFCRLCMMAHTTEQVTTYYSNIYEWWHGTYKSICFRQGKWKNNK